MRDKSAGIGGILASLSISPTGAVSAPRTTGGTTLLKIAVAFFILLKLAYGVFVPPNGDEAYYWLWGGYLQLSYYDHSPMVGWVSAIARAMLGWTPVALHLPAFASFLMLAYVFHRASRWLAPEWPEQYFWTCLLIFSASPLLNALTTLNYPDHLLILFASMAMLQLGKFLNGVLEHNERPIDLYIGAIFLGLAGLSKYSAVFIPAGLLIALIAAPRLRALFRSRHLYLAGALCLVIVSPVIIWNIQNQFATVELHAADRLYTRKDLFSPEALGRLVLLSIIEVSPFIIWGLGRFMFGRPADPRQTGLLMLLRGTAIVSTLFFVPLSAWAAIGRQVAPHWLVLSFLPFLLVAPLYIRSRVIITLHAIWGALVVGLVAAYFVAAPLLTGTLGMSDGEASRTFGQEQLGEAVAAAARQYDAALLVSINYTNASRLAFGMGTDLAISDFGGRVDRLAGRNLADYAGKTMILIGRQDYYADRFESIEPIGRVDTTRFGKALLGYDLFVGRGFKP